MLEHRHRFHGHGSVRRLYQQGSTARHRSMTMRYFKNPNRQHSRVTIVVGKKVYKSAARRNRIRRRIYEIVRKHWDEFAQPYDVALIVFDGATLLMSHEELESIVLGMFKQAKLLGSTEDK